MSLRRYAAKRDGNEGEIVRTLKAVGASVTKLSIKGAPDLLVGFRSVNYLIETKQRKGKLTEDQQTFVDEWNGQYGVARTPDEALRIIGAIT